MPLRAGALGACAWACALAGAPARADCIDDAAARHQVNAHVLRAIGWQESRLQPSAIGHNANGSIDLGAFQINSIHLGNLARLGIAREALADGCVSAEVAAWHYRRHVEALGNTWAAVGAYHSRTPARASWYANQVAAILVRWQVMAPGAVPVDSGRPPTVPVGGRSPAPSRAFAGAQPTAPPTSPPTSPPASAPASAPVPVPAGHGGAPRSFSTLLFLPPAH